MLGHNYSENIHSKRNRLMVAEHCNCFVHIGQPEVAHSQNGDCNNFAAVMDYDNCCAVADAWELAADYTTDIWARMDESAVLARIGHVSVPSVDPLAVLFSMPALARLVSFQAE